MLKASQADCFQEEVKCLKASKPVTPSSKLSSLEPEMDPTAGLICVGGCLIHMEPSCSTEVHPIVLDPLHAVTKLLIKVADAYLLHPGPDSLCRDTTEILGLAWETSYKGASKNLHRMQKMESKASGSHDDGPTSCDS